MKRKGIPALFGLLALTYLLMPLLMFDFTETARPFDEEYCGAREVAIGPRPYMWVPGGFRHLDIPGGPDYDVSCWPFRVWKPVCLAYLKIKGFEKPGQWR